MKFLYPIFLILCFYIMSCTFEMMKYRLSKKSFEESHYLYCDSCNYENSKVIKFEGAYVLKSSVNVADENNKIKQIPRFYICKYFPIGVSKFLSIHSDLPGFAEYPNNDSIKKFVEKTNLYYKGIFIIKRDSIVEETISWKGGKITHHFKHGIIHNDSIIFYYNKLDKSPQINYLTKPSIWVYDSTLNYPIK
jgi:hypothetical protein